MTGDDLASTPEQAIWGRLRRHVYGETAGEGRTADGKSLWENAPPYLRRHAAEHARRAGELDELLKDPEFLVHADAGPLGDVLAQRHDETPTDGPQATYLASYLAHRTSRPEARRQILLIDAVRLGQNRLANALHHDGARAVRWATGSGRSTALRYCLVPPGVRDAPGSVAVRASGVIEGRQVVVTTYQGTTDGREVAVWDLENGFMIRTLGRADPSSDFTAITVADRSEPTCAAIVPVADGFLVAVGYEDGTVHAWDALTGQPRSSYGFMAHPARTGGVGGVTALAFLPGVRGPRLVTGGRDGALRLWDAASPRETGLIDSYDAAHLGGVSMIAATSIPPTDPRNGDPDSSWRIVSGGVDGLVRSWALSSDDSFGPMSKIRGSARVASLSLACVPGTRRTLCLAGREDGSLTLFDARTGVEEARVTADGDGSADVLLLRGRLHAVCANHDGVVTLWDLESGQAVRYLPGHGEGRVTVGVVDLSGRPHVVSGCADGAVRVWNLEQSQDDQSPIPRPGPRQVQAVVLSPEGGLVAAARSEGVIVHHLADGSASEVRVPLPVTPEEHRLALGWLEGEGPLVALTTESSLTVFGPLTTDQTGHCGADQSGIPFPFRRYGLSCLDAVAVNGHGGRVLVATSRPDYPLELWSHLNGRLLRSAPSDLLRAGDPIRALALGSPAQHLVAGVTQRGLVTLWDYGRGWAVRLREELPGATSLALGQVTAGDGSEDSALYLAAGLDNGAVALWFLNRLLHEDPLDEHDDARHAVPANDERLEIVRCPDPVRALAVAPDGSIVVAQGCDLVTLDPW